MLSLRGLCPLRGLCLNGALVLFFVLRTWPVCAQAAGNTAGTKENLDLPFHVIVCDGGGTCHGADESDYLKQTLAVVKAQNVQHVPINTIGVLMEGREMQRDFLRQLARMNGGRYTEMTCQR